MRIVGVVLGLFSASACLVASLGCCTTREVLQSGLVPFSEPIAPPTSHGSGDIYAGVSGLTYLEPTSGAADLGHHVPASQLQLVGSLRPIAGLTIRPVGLLAIPTGASPISPGLRASTPRNRIVFVLGRGTSEQTHPMPSHLRHPSAHAARARLSSDSRRTSKRARSRVRGFSDVDMRQRGATASSRASSRSTPGSRASRRGCSS